MFTEISAMKDRNNSPVSSSSTGVIYTQNCQVGQNTARFATNGTHLGIDESNVLIIDHKNLRFGFVPLAPISYNMVGIVALYVIPG